MRSCRSQPASHVTPSLSVKHSALRSSRIQLPLNKAMILFFKKKRRERKNCKCSNVQIIRLPSIHCVLSQLKSFRAPELQRSKATPVGSSGLCASATSSVSRVASHTGAADYLLNKQQRLNAICGHDINRQNPTPHELQACLKSCAPIAKRT